MTKIALDIISQEKQLLSAEVDQISAPAISGDVTILPNHIPLFTKLNDGVIVIKTGSKIDEFAVLGGFMDVGPDSKVTVLADAVVYADDINVAKAEEARKLAQEVMKNRESEISFKEAEASLRKALLELKVAGKRRQRTPLQTSS